MPLPLLLLPGVPLSVPSPDPLPPDEDAGVGEKTAPLPKT